MPFTRGDGDRAAMRQVDLLRPPRHAAELPRQPGTAASSRRATASAHRRRAVEHEAGRPGELDRGALVEQVKPCGVQRAERAFGMHRLGRRRRPVLQIDRRRWRWSAWCRRRDTGSRRATGRAGCCAAMNTPCFACSISQVPSCSVMSPFGAVRLTRSGPSCWAVGGGHRIGPALLVHAAVAGVGQPARPATVAAGTAERRAGSGRRRDRVPATARSSRAAPAQRPAAATWSE